MNISTCPVCETQVSCGSDRDGLLSCPRCHGRFLLPGASSISLVGASGPEDPHLEKLDLPASFSSRYHLGRLLGFGGNASVYQAHTLQFQGVDRWKRTGIALNSGRLFGGVSLVMPFAVPKWDVTVTPSALRIVHDRTLVGSPLQQDWIYEISITFGGLSPVSQAAGALPATAQPR